MRIQDTISYNPIPVQLSVRGEEIRALTSCRAGKIVPHAVIPLLREDKATGSVTLDFEMAETVHPLLNAVSVTVTAHFVPWSAFERFSGMDSFNKSYRGVKEREADAAPVPFFSTIAFHRNGEFWKTLGIHAPQNQSVNAGYLEGYNLLVNWMRGMRSKSLVKRSLMDETLAEAFWSHPFMWHIKPDFDQAMMDGEATLTLVGQAPVSGLGQGTAVPTAASVTVKETGGATVVYPLAAATNGTTVTTATYLERDAATAAPAVFAELAGAQGKVSLANIELAKQTAAFARLREQYQGIDDDYLLDLLMMGVRIPDAEMRDPILLDKKTTVFGYSERHAMDGANLDQSVTTGKTRVTLRFRTPPMNTGGFIYICSQIVPEQLFERMQDVFMNTYTPETLPRFDRDFLDPEKVDVVSNRYVDVLHSTPTGIFGYAPLNHRWKRSLARIGGKFYRPVPDAFVEDRQRFWSVEQENPALNTDFYLVRNTLPHTVFADSLADPFEITTLGSVSIVGNTVFGKSFEESGGHFEAVSAVVDETRIVQP